MALLTFVIHYILPSYSCKLIHITFHVATIHNHKGAQGWAWTRGTTIGWNQFWKSILAFHMLAFSKMLGYTVNIYRHVIGIAFAYTMPIEMNNNIVLCSQSPLNLHHFCLTRFQIEGWLELIGMPSVDILHRSDCAWLCYLLSQYT